MKSRKHGGTVTAEMSVIRNDEDLEIEVHGYFNPAQNGGMTDPSWQAYVDFEYANDADGNEIKLTDDEIAQALEKLMEAA